MPIIKHARVGDVMDALIPDGLWDIPEDTMELTITSPTHTTTEAEVNALIEAEITKEQSELYKELRKPEYPSIGDQLDDLYHSGGFSTEMKSKIAAVKSKYPKP